MAIIIKEYLEKTGRYCSVQIFATDLDELSINKARKGCYSSGIAADISADRLQRFFRLQDNQYYICKEIRDTVIFATQNLIQDPPFTHLDFISCRNLLIYLSVELQKKIFPQFHYALNPNGILFLGSSESIGDYEELFSIVSKKWKIYQRKEARVSIPVSKLNLPMVRLAELPQEQQKSLEIKHPSGKIAQQIERFLLDNFTPASVIIDEFGKILYIQGHTGKYLEPKSGQPTWNVIDMAREGLRLPLVTALRKANKQSDIEPVRSSISVKTNSHFEAIDLNVLKITAPEALRGLLLVSFIPQEKKIPLPSPRKKPASARLDNSNQNEQLAQELYFTKESLRVTIDELQTSNEELQSTIEELQSTNEELQSANEELETSKEEMQSLNEELNVANGELQNKVEALSAINDDMQNLLNSTDIATIFLDTHLKIKRFTKQAKNIIKLIDSDIGRPLDDLISNLYYDHLIDDAKDVLDTLINKAKEVQTKSGDWYLLRILPYRTAENMIDGLVIAFVDINKLKKAEKSVHEAELTTAIVNTINQPLLVLDDQWTILTANPSFNQQFNNPNEELIGQSLFSINQSSWDSVLLKEALSNTLAKAVAFNSLCYDAVFPAIGQRKLLINGRILKQSSAGQALILLAIEDITERVQ